MCAHARRAEVAARLTHPPAPAPASPFADESVANPWSRLKPARARGAADWESELLHAGPKWPLLRARAASGEAEATGDGEGERESETGAVHSAGPLDTVDCPDTLYWPDPLAYAAGSEAVRPALGRGRRHRSGKEAVVEELRRAKQARGIRAEWEA